MADMIGRVLGGYRIEGQLGKGGHGVVYLATQQRLQRLVALKVVSAESSADPDFLERFKREGIAAAALDHPHIVPVYEADEIDGMAFLAMKFVDGASLDELIQEGRLEPSRALGILIQVADALDYAHRRGLVHRDVKPANVLLDARDYGYLSDFGLTRGEDAGRLAQTGQWTGTLRYTAPEQIRGQTVDGAADRYALAAMAYEALTGQPPFPHEERSAVAYAHLNETAAPPSAIAPELEGADDVMKRGLAKEPADRYPSAVAFVGALADALGISLAPMPQGASTRAGGPPPPPTPPPPPIDRSDGGGRQLSFGRFSGRQLAAIGAAVAALVVAVVLALTIPGSGDDHTAVVTAPSTGATTATAPVGQPVPEEDHVHTAPSVTTPVPGLGGVIPAGIEHWDLAPTDPEPVNLVLPDDAVKMEGAQGIRHKNKEVAQITGTEMPSETRAVELARDIERQLGTLAHERLALATGTGSLFAVDSTEIAVLQFDHHVIVCVLGTVDGAKDLASHLADAMKAEEMG